MNVQNRKSSRRRGQALVRTVLGLGTAAAGSGAYLLSDASRVEMLILSAIVVGLTVFGVALYGRARSRREWSAAWEAYAAREVGRGTMRRSVADETLSWAATS